MEIIIRQQAKEQGLARYFTGKPCKHGHISEKTVSGSNCVECYNSAYWGTRERSKKITVPEHLAQYLITKKQAKLTGQTTYFTGQPCKNGHIASRWTSSSCCVICERNNSPFNQCCNKYAPFRSTIEYKKEKDKKYAKDNAEKIRERVRLYQQNNKEKYLAYQAAYQSIRRVLKRKAQPEWVDISNLKILYKDMQNRNKQAGRVAYHVDHIVPLQGENVCGLHVPWNLQIITAEENLTKSNKWEAV
jgi:adenylate kinase family enzyme